MTNTQRIYGRRNSFFFRSKYDYGTIEIDHGTTSIVHVFVSPQDLKGLEIASMDPIEEVHGTTVGGDVMIGNPEDGYYNVPFEIWHKDGTIIRCLFGSEEFDLERGSVFVVGTGYSVRQLDCHSFDDAVANLWPARRGTLKCTEDRAKFRDEPWVWPIHRMSRLRMEAPWALLDQRRRLVWFCAAKQVFDLYAEAWMLGTYGLVRTEPHRVTEDRLRHARGRSAHASLVFDTWPFWH